VDEKEEVQYAAAGAVIHLSDIAAQHGHPAARKAPAKPKK
jgi:hypothetical protein